MHREVLVREPVNTLVRMTANGVLLPTSFVWRDRTRYVANIGRQWEEQVQGRRVHCSLIQAVDNNTFELHWDPANNQWSLQRAWLHDQVA